MRIVASMLIGLSLLVVAGCQDKKPPQESNQTMTLDQVPEKVRASLKRESDQPVESVNRHELNGVVVYEATVKTRGQSYDLELDSDGRLLRRSARAAVR